MPICFRPGARVAHVLKDDTGPNPPRFFLKALTGEQSAQLADTIDDFKTQAAGKKGSEGVAYFYDVLRPYVLGWESLSDGEKEIPSLSVKLESILSLGECQELIQAAMGGIGSADKSK